MPSLFGSSADIGAMPTWAMLAGEILQEELAAAACFFPLLVAAAAAGGAAVAPRYKHALQSTRERIASQRQRCLKRERTKKYNLRPSRGKLGQIRSVRKVFGQQGTAVESHIDHISSTIICFPNMTKLAISSEICLGFVISCRQRKNR